MKIDFKINLKNVVFLLAILKTCIIFGQQLEVQKRILIDVGHGGTDPGAIGVNGIQEKDVVLNIAKEIIKFNNLLLDNKLDIYLTRYGDNFIALSDRSRLAKALKADVFVSLHCNASKTTSKGMDVYVHDSKNLNTKESIILGLSILNENSSKLGFETRGVKFANFQVLRDMIDFCPAILVELGFLTNFDEADYFLNPSNTKAIALAILVAIYNHIG
ncbi:N-acetylmuramoyl-L-alanine amidase family protein [Confluentibacter sediminis]|uniref:N-acetylmuramoyl-L-alanine amidase family protein n=1 Tax=Confluentibacter sediminis TaxID=2219045 RepID=UPI000DAB8483|nr:N-acetylmuramoyl-L-alanine amidase [Confluentibacter sediminis]